jgi:putative restriction endonuclease
MDNEQLRQCVQDLNIWKRGGQRAPHKPLLLLLALSRLIQGKPRLAAFPEIDHTLGELLERYGPPRKSHHPEYPFWHLQNDGLWEVEQGGSLIRRKGSTDPLRTELIAKNVRGGLPEDVFRLLQRDHALLEEIVNAIADSHFPESMRDDLLRELSLTDLLQMDKCGRDSAFRFAVVQAYEHRCAVCGYDVRFGRSDLGLEAAHIRWHQAGGPDIVQNGVALCCLHHKGFDRGAIGIGDDLRLLISADLYGREAAAEWFVRFHHKALRMPHSTGMLPARQYLAWHRREVFRSPSRD